MNEAFKKRTVKKIYHAECEGIPQIENPLLGMPVYIREGATGLFDNSYTCTIPTSGYVRVIGHVIYQSPISGYNTKYMIKLKPSNDWYEI